jgi:hypothetical protein
VFPLNSSSKPPVQLSVLHSCRFCKLELDSLGPLAQLHSLRTLHLLDCTGLTTPALEAFLRTAVQGGGLSVFVDLGPAEKEDMQAMHNTLVQSLGAKNVPRLSLEA